jgi:hypothetical protein
MEGVVGGFRGLDSLLLRGKAKEASEAAITKTDRSLLPSAKTAEEVAEEKGIALGSAGNFSRIKPGQALRTERNSSSTDSGRRSRGLSLSTVFCAGLASFHARHVQHGVNGTAPFNI